MKRHRTDAVSLAFGAIFLLIAGWWLISRSVQIGLPALAWLLVLGLILVGALGVVRTTRANRRSGSEPDQPPWPDEPVE